MNYRGVPMGRETSLDSSTNELSIHCHGFVSISWVRACNMCMRTTQPSLQHTPHLGSLSFSSVFVPEPYDYPSWCLILVFSVHASGAAIFIFEWLSPSGLDRGNKPIRGNQQGIWMLCVFYPFLSLSLCVCLS